MSRPRGNVTQTIQPDGRTLTYVYDAVNRTITVTYPDGRTVVYTRDAIGRIAEVSMVKDGVTTVLASRKRIGTFYFSDSIDSTYPN